MGETEDGATALESVPATVVVSADTANGFAPEDPPAPKTKTVRYSDPSNDLIEESMRLLDMKSSVAPTLRPPIEPLFRHSRSPSPDSYLLPQNSPYQVTYPKATPRFKRIDFDDRLEDIAGDRKPAWKSLQDSIKDSYHNAKKAVERTEDERQFLETTLNRPRRVRGESPFRHLDSDTGFVPSVRSRTSLMMPSLSDRSRLATSASMSNVFASGSGPYAAPAVSATQGIEHSASRYELRANDIESRLLKTAPLPKHMKTITTKEFRRAPEPASGGVSEKDDYDFSAYCPRPYYSRPNRDDPDYFDFDLQHSVDLFKRPEGKYTPRGPQDWETKLLGEAAAKGSAPISGYMFTKGENDWRSTNSSFLSAALRTPKYWEQRFESLGKQIRDSNPVSLESINRNRQVPNRFSEYRDPDFEDYEDPRSDD